MDNKTDIREHKLNILNRQKTEITGISKVISIEENMLVLITTAGKLTIKGSKLHADKLDVDIGILEFTGDIISVNYVDYKTSGEKAAGLVGRLFK